VTAAWREMLDAGMYANFPGFLMADSGARQNTNIFRVPPGGMALVKTGGMPINQAIMPLPYKEPGGALMSLVESMAQTGMRVGGTAEMAVGEGRPDAPVGTTIALIEQAKVVMSSVHKRLHASQAEEFQLLRRTFEEHPESFWQRNRNTAFPWDEKTFTDALKNFLLVPQADPNTASSIQRMMKVVALKQLAAQNPALYDPIAVDIAALQAMGWNNPQQFMAPPSAQGKPPPELLEKMANIQAKQKEADARMLDSQTRAQESQARLQLDAQKLQMEMGGGLNGGIDPEKAMQFQIQQAEIQQRQQDTLLDAINRKRDRESRERLAAVKLAEEAARNPQGLGVMQSIITPDMLARLEGNEPGLDGTKTGEL